MNDETKRTMPPADGDKVVLIMQYASACKIIEDLEAALARVTAERDDARRTQRGWHLSEKDVTYLKRDIAAVKKENARLREALRVGASRACERPVGAFLKQTPCGACFPCAARKALKTEANDGNS